MAYDRIDWHSGGEYPADLPEENGGIHIGLFLAWAFSQGMVGEFHREESARLLGLLARREITGLVFLVEACDGKFWEEDLDERGNAFAIEYYDDKSAFAQQYGSYLNDYCDVFNRHADNEGFEYPSIYHVENNWENFERLKPVLDERLAQWKVWSADPANRQLDPKTQFLQACHDIGQQFLMQYGFKPNKAGSVWKKSAADKDTVVKLSFEPDLHNSRLDVRMAVYIHVANKKLKKWLAERNGDGDDSVLFGSLRRSHKSSDTITWQVSGSQAPSSFQEIGLLLEERAVPLLELFGDRPRALEHLATHGGEFPGICDAESTPLAFLLCFGTQEQAQRFFTNYFESRPSPWRRNIYHTFKRLQEGETWDYSSYLGENDVKLAFQNGLTLPQRT